MMGREGESSKYFLQNVISGFVSKSGLNEAEQGRGDHPGSCVRRLPLDKYWQLVEMSPVNTCHLYEKIV